jgi:protein-S-isoprenylcysteine O-methyltransferase Ste14
MSHRTQDLPPLRGIRYTIRELRYHEIARQLLAVVLILLYTVTARTTPFLAAVGLSLALAGTAFRLYASGFIVKNKELATNGPYALVRHPLYTGNILIIIGFSLANGMLWGLPLALVFFWFYYPTAIEYEDRKLHGIFKEQWEVWAQNVPALVPALGNAKTMGGGSWSFAKSTKRNGELVIVVYILLCMGWVLRQVV